MSDSDDWIFDDEDDDGVEPEEAEEPEEITTSGGFRLPPLGMGNG